MLIPFVKGGCFPRGQTTPSPSVMDCWRGHNAHDAGRRDRERPDRGSHRHRGADHDAARGIEAARDESASLQVDCFLSLRLSRPACPASGRGPGPGRAAAGRFRSGTNAGGGRPGRSGRAFHHRSCPRRPGRSAPFRPEEVIEDRDAIRQVDHAVIVHLPADEARRRPPGAPAGHPRGHPVVGVVVVSIGTHARELKALAREHLGPTRFDLVVPLRRGTAPSSGREESGWPRRQGDAPGPGPGRRPAGRPQGSVHS